MTSFLAFIFVLGVLIFVHEFGHFAMARRIGIRVLTFSLGFGPKILKYRKGDTEYCVSAIPLGGYVKMAGENPDEQRAGRDDEFLSKTKWQRFQVLIMGPATNIIFAVVVMTVVLYQGAEVPSYEQQPPVVGDVVMNSPADQIGIQAGDQILQVSGRPVETWQEFMIAILPRAERETELLIDNVDGERLVLRLTPEASGRFDSGDIGVRPVIRPQVRNITPGDPADQFGLEVNDIILVVDGLAMVSLEDFIAIIQKSANEDVTLTVQRGETRVEVTVIPASREGVGRIGVGLTPEVLIVEPGPLEAVGLSFQQNYEWSGLIFQTLGGLVTGDTSPKQLVGPVGIAQISGTAAEVGWVSLFGLMAMISLNLGILNLLPIPVLDGGHIFIMALEGAFRHDFSVRAKERMLFTGFVLLMMLMVTVMYNDLARIDLIRRLIPWL